VSAVTHFDLLLSGLHLATLDGDGWGEVRDGAIGVVGDTLAFVGPVDALPAHASWTARRDFDGAWATPGSSTATRTSSTRATARASSSGACRA
jgi:cytosine/adenosine deaminase-related metal-dependent hydrolase